MAHASATSLICAPKAYHYTTLDVCCMPASRVHCTGWKVWQTAADIGTDEISLYRAQQCRFAPIPKNISRTTVVTNVRAHPDGTQRRRRKASRREENENVERTQTDTRSHP